MAGASFVRISSLIWADILVSYAFFVMQNYLTDVWGLSFTHSAGILNIWNAICLILPGFCLYLVDEFLGHFRMLVVASISYSVGIGFITMSVPPVLANSTGSCKGYESECIGHTHRVLFYTGMALITVGISGNKVSLRPFLAEQNDNPDGQISGMPSQLLGYFCVAIVGLAGAIALPYIKPWTLRFGIPAICTTVGTFLFLSGWSTYKKNPPPPEGSPITNVFRVFVVFSTKMFKRFDLDAKVYKKSDQETESFGHTRFLRCLEKAAMCDPKDDVNSKWRVCSVGEVEEAKIAVRMIPMWMTFIICGIVSSIGNTYFVEQANHMNRKIGNWKVPLQMLLLLSEGSRTIFGCFADSLLYKRSGTARVPAALDPAGGPQTEDKVPHEGKRPAYGIGIAMIFSILCCITAARVEKRRLYVIRHHGLLDKPDDDIPMRVYWLLFQFVLLAGLNAFMQKSVVAFYAYQSPDSMKKYLDHFTRGVSGIGFMFSVLTVHLVGQISEDGGRQNWFQFTLNKSRLDRYYWVLAALSSVNLVVFIVVASVYRYKNCEAKDEVVDDLEAYEGPNEGAPEENNDEQNG